MFLKQREAEKASELVNIVSTPAKLCRKCWNATNTVGHIHHMFLAQMLILSILSKSGNMNMNLKHVKNNNKKRKKGVAETL